MDSWIGYRTAGRYLSLLQSEYSGKKIVNFPFIEKNKWANNVPRYSRMEIKGKSVLSSDFNLICLCVLFFAFFFCFCSFSISCDSNAGATMEKLHREILRRRYYNFTHVLACYFDGVGFVPADCHDYLLFGNFLEGNSG